MSNIATNQEAYLCYNAKLAHNYHLLTNQTNETGIDREGLHTNPGPAPIQVSESFRLVKYRVWFPFNEHHSQCQYFAR